jgi:hypothetical protein
MTAMDSGTGCLWCACCLPAVGNCKPTSSSCCAAASARTRQALIDTANLLVTCLKQATTQALHGCCCCCCCRPRTSSRGPAACLAGAQTATSAAWTPCAHTPAAEAAGVAAATAALLLTHTLLVLHIHLASGVLQPYFLVDVLDGCMC